MTDNEHKAQELYALAEKKASPNTGFLSKLFGGTTRQEEAAELYVRAANSFKMAKNWRGAGESFRKAAETQQNLGSRHEAASNYVDAANCFKKIDHGKAIDFLHHAIQIYADMGRFTIAAKHHVSIAEIYETESMDIDQAIANYEQAADYYKGEESNSSANKCLLKVALYAAQQEQYEKAIEIYETIGTSAMDNQLLRYSAKDYFFRAALCHMCIETQNAANAVARYEEMFPTFTDARECKLLKNLLVACEDQNIDAYTDAVKSYDSISRLDQWFTTMLLRIKKSIAEEPNLK